MDLPAAPGKLCIRGKWMKPIVLIVMGVSGSGKTTLGRRLATELGWDYFDADDYHSPDNIARMQRGQPLTDADRAGWLAALAELIAGRLRQGAPAVLACSALKQVYRRQLRQGAEAVQFIYLQGSYAQIARRMRRRTRHYMPVELLRSQFETLEEPRQALTLPVEQPPQALVEQVRVHFGL